MAAPARSRVDTATAQGSRRAAAARIRGRRIRDRRASRNVRIRRLLVARCRLLQAGTETVAWPLMATTDGSGSWLLFDTPIGHCGLAWGPHGIVGVLLPEGSE